MRKLIDKQDTIEALIKTRGFGKRALDVLEAMPEVLIDAAPEKCGKWKHWEDTWEGDDTFECSVCGAAFSLIDGTPEENDYYYCPHCGARMEGVENGTVD